LRDAPPGGIMWISDALVAQPDRASDYESEGRRFESCRARPPNSCICRSFSIVPSREHEASWACDRGLTVARAQGRLALEPNYYASFRCNTAFCTRSASAGQAGLLLGAKPALARRTALQNARPPPSAYPEIGENRYPEWCLYGSGLASLGQFEGSAR
jgi:hypothetical protein